MWGRGEKLRVFAFICSWLDTLDEDTRLDIMNALWSRYVSD